MYTFDRPMEGWLCVRLFVSVCSLNWILRFLRESKTRYFPETRVSYLVGALSPVSHKGLYQGYPETRELISSRKTWHERHSNRDASHVRERLLPLCSPRSRPTREVISWTEDGPVDTGKKKQGSGPLKTTPPSIGDSSGSAEKEDCHATRGKRRRSSDSGSSGAEGVAYQTPLKRWPGRGGRNDRCFGVVRSVPIRPTTCIVPEAATTSVLPTEQVMDKGEVGSTPDHVALRPQKRGCLLGEEGERVKVTVQVVCESRGGRPGLSVLTSLLVSVDVKQYWTMFRHWSQLVPNMSLICQPISEDIKQHYPRVKARPRIPPKDRGLPPEQWKC